MRRRAALPRIPFQPHGPRDVVAAVDRSLRNLPFILLAGMNDEEEASLMMTLACNNGTAWQDDVVNWSPGDALPDEDESDPFFRPLCERYTLFLADIRRRLRAPMIDAITAAIRDHGVTLPWAEGEHPVDAEIADLTEFWRPYWSYVLTDYKGPKPPRAKRLPSVEVAAHVYLCFDVCTPKVFPYDRTEKGGRSDSVRHARKR